MTTVVNSRWREKGKMKWRSGREGDRGEAEGEVGRKK